MNNRYLLYLVLFLSCIASIPTHTNPRNNVIVVDMDDVFVNARKWSIKTSVFTNIASHLPSLGWKMLTSGQFRRKFKCIRKNNKHDDLLFAAARLYKPLRKKIDPLLNAIHAKRKLIPDVITLLKSLKDRGYTIIVATNRCRIGFELTAKKLNFDQLYNGKKLFDAVIVGGKADFEEKTTVCGKRFSRLTYDHTLDDYITAAQASKPDKAYYQVVRNVVDQYVADHRDQFDSVSPEIIFFDDYLANIEGANNSDCNIKAYQVPKKKKSESMRSNLEQHFSTSIV